MIPTYVLPDLLLYNRVSEVRYESSANVVVRVSRVIRVIRPDNVLCGPASAAKRSMAKLGTDETPCSRDTYLGLCRQSGVRKPCHFRSPGTHKRHGQVRTFQISDMVSHDTILVHIPTHSRLFLVRLNLSAGYPKRFCWRLSQV